jgi:hypothetical protein
MIRKIEGFLPSRISHLTLAISLRASADKVASAVIRDKKTITMPSVNESEGHPPLPCVRVIYDETHREMVRQSFHHERGKPY